MENSIEDGVPSPGGGKGDGNGDGIPDREQSDVASLPNAVNGSYVTLVSSGGVGLQAVQAISPTVAAPAGVALPQGLFTFQVSVTVGSAYSVTLILHAGTPPAEYWKYGPTPDDPTNHWYEFTYNGETGAIIVGNRVTLHFVDGNRGDSDLSANGVIVDPGGPALRTIYYRWLPTIRSDPKQVYTNDFSQGAGESWLQQSIGAAPNGQRFLGEFGNETVKLNLAALPAHTQATVAFDLYVIRSWDGNQTVFPSAAAVYAGMTPDGITGALGPDRWMLQANGQTLLDTTFANILEFPQAYPGNFPGGDHPAQTGAAAANSLGYIFAAWPMDAVYHIERTFAHSGGSLTLDFAALGLQIISDESWGLDNVTVTVQ